MKNWKEELKEQLWKLKYLELSVNDIIKEVEKIEQEGYKRGLEDKEKINKCDLVKLTYEELIDLKRAEEEGRKEELEVVLELLKSKLLPANHYNQIDNAFCDGNNQLISDLEQNLINLKINIC